MGGQRAVEIFLIALPWVWLGVAAFILARLAPAAARAGAVTAFGLALAAYGFSSFFVTPYGRGAWWLLAWQGASAAGMVAALIGMCIGPRGEAGG